MTEAERKQLEITACKVRMGVIEGVYNAKSGHPGGSLSAADLFTYLYFKEMNVEPRRSPYGQTGTGSSSPRATPPPACTPPLP